MSKKLVSDDNLRLPGSLKDSQSPQAGSETYFDDRMTAAAPLPDSDTHLPGQAGTESAEAEVADGAGAVKARKKKAVSQIGSEFSNSGAEASHGPSGAPDDSPSPQTGSETSVFLPNDEDPGGILLPDALPVQTDSDMPEKLSEGAKEAPDTPSASLAEPESGTVSEIPAAELRAEADTPPSGQTGSGTGTDEITSDDDSALPVVEKSALHQTGRKTAANGNSSQKTGAGTHVRTKKNAFPNGSDGDDENPGESTSARHTGRTTSSVQSAAAFRSMRNSGPPIVSIDNERTVESDTDKKQNAFLDLVESMKGRKILSGTIQGIERSEDDPDLSFAVVYHGDFKVLIPADEAIERPLDFRGRDPGDTMNYLLTKRLGAEVDYIIIGTEPETGLAGASRLKAMAQKRREYYLGTDRDGYNLMYDGVIAEARVISVIRAGIFVEVFGAECYISLRELSYQRWLDAAAHFQPGHRVLVKVLGINREDRNNIRITASVKQAGEDPYEKALRRYSVGNRYVGTVSLVDTTGVFVSLDGGIDCLCAYPKRGRPPRGSRVTVRILGINHESNRIWGAIVHMTTAR